MLVDEKWDGLAREELKNDLELPLAAIFKPIKLSWDSGTTFFILSPSDQVDELFLKNRSEVDPTDDYPPDWLKAYHAFSTFWDPFHNTANREFSIQVSLSGKPLLRTNRYWEPEDFKNCDHHIRITVTEEGFAKGYVKNYGQPKQTYSRQLKFLPKGHSSPGPFLIEIGYVQGEKSNSPLPDDIHDEITKRLLHAGGFSIYLNNVRVQPYGGIDSDFAGFEERRLKNAGRYYFSTRRMFGGVFIPSKEKTNLVEKAGREGFVVNGARRGLRLWVEDLFVDLADTYFGRKADRQDKAERRRKKESEAARARLDKEKADYLASVRVHKAWLRDFELRAKTQVQALRGIFASESNALPGTYFSACEKELLALSRLSDELRATPGEPPSGISLEGDILSSVDDYLAKREAAIRNINREIANQTKALHALATRAKGVEEQEQKISARIGDADRSIRRSIELLLEPAIQKAKTLERELNEFADAQISKLTKVRSELLAGVTPKQVARDKTGELARKLESAIQAQQEEFERSVGPRLRRLASDLKNLTNNTSSTLLLSEQASEIQLLKERHAFLVEMAQLGIVLETATHEHEKQVTGIRSSIELLSKGSDAETKKVLKFISDSFNIRDERLRLFDPLLRRRSATEKSLNGAEIEAFLRHRFSKECELKDFIRFTKSFRATELREVKRPIVLGALHNILHNALYWSHKGTNSPEIRFSGAGETIVISDSGPGVNETDLERIFEPGFSRRPYGRGFGLYIAREALRGIGYDLTCPTQPELGALDGANFIIAPKYNAAN